MGKMRAAKQALGKAPSASDFEEKLERAKGFEPSTPTLARLCSTPELHPHPWDRQRRWRLYGLKRGGLQQVSLAFRQDAEI